MTAGRGIAHAETSPATATAGRCTASSSGSPCPTAHRHDEPAFDHHADLPGGGRRRRDGPGAPRRAGRRPLARPRVHPDRRRRGRARPPAPDLARRWSPTSSTPCCRVRRAAVDGDAVRSPGPMLYLGCGRTIWPCAPTGRARLLLLGGEPFEEEIVMWWNFIGRTPRGDRGLPRRLDGRAALRRGPVRGRAACPPRRCRPPRCSPAAASASEPGPGPAGQASRKGQASRNQKSPRPRSHAPPA